ncbi:RHS repeat domain-containing protein [Tenacibaculum maritimum]|uniref:RHS repeat domain-containing protein n=1 Tax=Tenacibaculum maritimum TaxID=107401 RepID=UPI0021D03DD1|nr:RHS repeat-associated core domain-containing protein [Tenacibaculum maritimum]
MDFEYGTTLLNRGYTGHEHFMGVALIHINGRMYDAKLGHFLSPDNFIQEPFSTQSFNRFGYVWNNPLKFTDPSGEIFWSVVIGAYLGGVQANGSYNPFEWKGNASTLLGVLGGAIIGGISGGVGAYAAAKLAPLITTAGGFLGGAVSGFIGGAVGGTILGGVIGGIRSVFHGKGFWTGKDLASKATAKTISSLKTESVHDVAPKNNLSNQKLDLKANSNINKLESSYVSKNSVDGGYKGFTRKPFTPNDVIKSVKGDSFSIRGSTVSGGKTTNAEILMNRRDFSNLVNDFKAQYKGVRFEHKVRGTSYKFNFGNRGSGFISRYGANSYRFVWSSQGVNYKFKINVFENIR